MKNFGDLGFLNGDLLIESNNLIRQYDTNILERQNINNFTFRSDSKINRLGFLNNYEFLVKNTNSNNENTEGLTLGFEGLSSLSFYESIDKRTESMQEMGLFNNHLRGY